MRFNNREVVPGVPLSSLAAGAQGTFYAEMPVFLIVLSQVLRASVFSLPQ